VDNSQPLSYDFAGGLAIFFQELPAEEIIMKRYYVCTSLLGAVAIVFAACSRPAAPKPDYPAAAVPFTDVEISDSFWSPRIENNRTVSIPALLAYYESSERVPDTRLIEAVGYLLAKQPDAALRSRVDPLIDRVIENFRSREPGQRWKDLKDGELYQAGHFFEAAVAYHQATGYQKILDAAVEIADHIDSVFGPDRRRDVSGHEEVKIGLVRLYRHTGDEKYLRLAKFFLDERGVARDGRVLYGEYAQDHEPVKSQARAVGHAVRATYLYAPLTDIAALTNGAEYAAASRRIWEDAVSRRTYLTGGVGSHRDFEDFGDDYELPNLSGWSEICAAIGNIFWNHRLFLLDRDGRAIDVLERILYNGLLAGVSLDGKTYLYQTPLKAYGAFARQPRFGPNCCPPNLARFLASLGGLVYAQDDGGLYVNLFIGSRAAVDLKGTRVAVSQETRYPWDGAVKITLSPDRAKAFALSVRIPGWSRREPMWGGLYRYTETDDQPFNLLLNGRPAEYLLDKGYARIERKWAKGDRVEISFPMPVRRVLADDRVADNRGLAALERGPIVYCAEGADNGDAVFDLQLPDSAELRFSLEGNLLGGIGAVTGKALRLGRGPDRVAVERREHNLIAVPFYSFGNRGSGEMSVWLAREESKAVLPPVPTIASMSRASSSCGNGTVADNYPGHGVPTIARRFYPSAQDGSGEIRAIFDQVEPVNSADGSWTFLRLRPQTGDRAWVQYDFRKPETVSSVEVYWKDDREYCVLPKAWRLLYREGSRWIPVRSPDAYGVEKDMFNKVLFQPVTTSGLRLEIELQGKLYRKGDLGPPDANYMPEDLVWYEGGVIEWRVNN